MADKNPQGRIAESVDFEAVNKDVDNLVQSAIGLLQDPSRSGATASGKSPGFAEVDLSATRDEVNNVRARRTATNMTIDSDVERMNTAGNERSRAQKAEGQANSDKALADQARASQEAAIYQALGESMQIRPSDIAEVAQTLRKERAVAEGMRDHIAQMQSVGLLDNPLEWLTNQIQLPAVIEPYNRQVDKVTTIENVLDNSITTANNAAQYNNKAIPAITAAQGNAAARAAVEKANVLAAQTSEELARQNVTFAVQKLSNDLMAANATVNMSQLELQKAHYEYQAKINAIAHAENNATRMLKAAELLEKLEKTKGLDVLLANYDRIMGHPNGTTTRYNFERFGQAAQQNITAIGAGSGGSNPFEATINYSLARPGPLASQATVKLHGWLQDKLADIGADPNIQRLDEKQKPLAMNKRLLEKIEDEKTDAWKPGSVFHEVSPAEMLISGNIDPNSKLAKILEPYKNVPTVPTELIAASIRKEFPSVGQAAVVLADYYRKNINLRNITTNSSIFKIDMPAEYNVPLQDFRGYPGVYGNFGAYKGKLDLTKPDQAAKYLLFMDMRDVSKQGMMNSTAVPGSPENKRNLQRMDTTPPKPGTQNTSSVSSNAVDDNTTEYR